MVEVIRYQNNHQGYAAATTVATVTATVYYYLRIETHYMAKATINGSLA